MMAGPGEAVAYNPKDRGEERFTVAGVEVTRAAYVRFGRDGRAYAFQPE